MRSPNPWWPSGSRTWARSNPLVGDLSYRLIVSTASLLLRSALTIQVSGQEHIPASGRAILVCNHPSAIDPFLITTFVRRRVYGLVHPRNFAHPVQAWLLRRLGALPAESGAGALPSLLQAQDLLQREQLFMVMAEGAAHAAPQPGPFQGGFLTLALLAQAPIVPIAITGSDHALAEPENPTRLRHWMLRPATVRIAVLEPIPADHLSPKRAAFRAQVEDVRQRILAACLAAADAPALVSGALESPPR